MLWEERLLVHGKHGKRDFMNKNVLVTGSNNGIGLACVNRFLKESFCVFAHYNSSCENLQKLRSDRLHIIQGDFTTVENVYRVFNEVMSFGRTIDVLINNAGTFSIANCIEDIEIDDFDKIINVNLKAAFILSQKALTEMKKKRGGRIVNISSIGVKYGGGIGSIPYTISKAGLEIITKSFAKEGAAYNVLVNAVRVGLTDTRFHKLNPKKNLEERIQMIPLKRMATSKEIAEVIFFLSTDINSYMTGSVVTVAGGE